MSAKPLRKCPRCGKLKLQRLIGAGAGILFKGSGFYETDYKRKTPPKSSEPGTGEGKGGSDSSPEKKSADPAPEKKASGDAKAS